MFEKLQDVQTFERLKRLPLVPLSVLLRVGRTLGFFFDFLVGVTVVISV